MRNWNSSLSQTWTQFGLQTLKMNRYSLSNLTALNFLMCQMIFQAGILVVYIVWHFLAQMACKKILTLLN